MTLVEANEAQKIARDRLTHAEWGKRLSVEQFLAREVRLRAHRWAAKEMRTWLLLEGVRVLASCESFRMDSLTQGGRGSAYGIASVYTEPSLRGRGNASAMMSRLMARLPELDKHAHSSILFSDVGAGLYERAGYQARKGSDRYLPPLGAPERDPRVRPIFEDELQTEWARLPVPAAEHVIWPSADQVDWHLERERIYAETLRRPRPPSIGARVGESRIFWCVYFSRDWLSVLYLDARSPDEAELLLREAQRAAAVAGVSSVQLWESAAVGPWREAVSAFPPVEREGYLPMIRPFVPAAAAERWDVLPRALWI